MDIENLPNFTRHSELYPHKDRKLHITALLTESGEKAFYDSVSQCNACGSCNSVCPSYIVKLRENHSPRGRNQLIRMIMEEKLRLEHVKEEMRPMLGSCLACGACKNACPAGTATPEHVLEARRALNSRTLAGKIAGLTASPLALGLACRTLATLNLFKIPRLLQKLGFFKLPGLAELEKTFKIKPRFVFLKNKLPKPGATAPEWLYFNSCGGNYLFPETGLASLKILDAALGPHKVLNNACCGWLSYAHGSLETARKSALKNITAYEKASVGKELPVVCDCRECAQFLKTYEQLFTEEPALRERAKRFAANVRDITEAATGEKLGPLIADKTANSAKITLQAGSFALGGKETADAAARALKTLFPSQFVELPEPGSCGGNAAQFINAPELSEALLKRRIYHIAGTEAELVVVLTAFDLMFLGSGLKKYYPRAKALHYAELLAGNLKSG